MNERSLIEAKCTGRGADGDHCCYQRGNVCPYLVENEADRRYACDLLIRHDGDWSAMAADPDYREIGDFWLTISKPFNYCETFSPIFCCRRDLNPGYRNEVEAREAGAII